MQAPKCPLCGTSHWSRESCPAKGRPQPVTRNVTPRPAVTRNTDVTLEERVVRLEARVRALEAERVSVPATPLPVTGVAKSRAEYMRRYRAKQAASQTEKGERHG